MSHPTPNDNRFLDLFPGIDTPAVAIGNGESRKGYDLELLRGRCLTIGCNALYRDYWPDILVCVDPKMQAEIALSIFPKERVSWRYRNRGMASGPCSMALAADRGHRTVYLLGMDCNWTPHDASGKQLVNNMYAGTPNYSPRNSNKVSPMAWYNHAAGIIQEHPMTRFVQIGVHSLHPRAEEKKFNPTIKSALSRVEFATWADLLGSLR